MIQLIWLIPLLPFAGFLINGLLNKNMPKSLVGIVAAGSVLAAFVISLFIFFEIKNGNGQPVTVTCFEWFSAGNLHISFSFLADRLSAIFLLVITGVGFLIHLYSIGYMHDDEDYPRYFAYLNLFVFFMLLLVLGSNYLVMFAGWEGVGLCSYLLIGFWFKNTSYNNAAKKAFVMNRIGDLGFLLGLFLIFVSFGSLDFATVFTTASTWQTGDPTITAITLLLFIGAMGKSAQIPLYTWLPDAMAGPTPVSALIHAATMVTAGIYMIIRSHVLYMLSPVSSEFVAVIGVCTALFAAIIGLAQTDIKKVLAYSTVSQLGYMFVALGVGAYTTGLFHVVTHAFFKALLFLCAGSVIHAMGGEQDVRKMGGLKKYVPVTHITFLIGTLAIAGFPPFAGFFSKDEILAYAYARSMPLFIVLFITSLLTALYMFRLYWLTFHGNFRGSHHQQEHLHESPASMTVPLICLAFLSTAGGFIGMPSAFHAPHLLNEFMEPLYVNAGIGSEPAVSHNFEYALMAVLVILLIVIIAATRNYYVSKNRVPGEDSTFGAATRLVYNKFWIDELYDSLITKPLQWISKNIIRNIEIHFIDRIVNLFGTTLNVGSSTLRLIQTGNIGFYVFVMVAGVLAMLIFKLMI
jgi:NADH-quinone oxidoreductase subunit L